MRPIVIFGPVADVARHLLLRDAAHAFESPQIDAEVDSKKKKENAAAPTGDEEELEAEINTPKSGIIKIKQIKEILKRDRHWLVSNLSGKNEFFLRCSETKIKRRLSKEWKRWKMFDGFEQMLNPLSVDNCPLVGQNPYIYLSINLSINLSISLSINLSINQNNPVLFAKT